MDNKFKNGCSGHGICAKGCCQSDKPLTVYDYLADIPGSSELTDLVEVQFKNTRKGYYRNTNHLPLEKGDIVAVEATPGHDIGVVTLTGRLVQLQIKKANLKNEDDIKRIYRKARTTDLEKYQEAQSREHDTMIRARQIALNLGLEMKIGDVEYQGDCGKAIFYYIADGRVDFRQLIKILAETFRVRIEMKQIGARQEAGRIGGIGPCGRILCCAGWLKNFVSVSTAAARLQDLSPNPQKLAGQCAKLKCCLNFEADTYMEASKKLPSKEIVLYTQDAEYYYFKADILKGEVTYSTDRKVASNLVVLKTSQVFDIIAMNKRGEKPVKLTLTNEENKQSTDLAQQDSLTRFDRKKKNKNRKKNGNNNSPENNQQSTSPSTDSNNDDNKQDSPNGIANENKERLRDPNRRKKNKKNERNANGNDAAVNETKDGNEKKRNERNENKKRKERERNNRPRPDTTPNNPNSQNDNTGIKPE